MKYFVDLIDADDIVGWCCDLDEPGRPVTVLLLTGDDEVASVTASLPRPDVAERHGTHGNHGFRIPHGGNLFESAASLTLRLQAPGVESIEVPVADLLGREQVAPWSRVVPYLKGRQGTILIASNAPSVLPALLPREDSGRVVIRALEELLGPVPDATGTGPLLVCLPGISSASSLAPALLDGLMARLGSGGALFLEALVAPEHPHAPEMNFHPALLGNRYCTVPTMRGLREIMLKDYVVRYLAPSRRVWEVGQYHILQVVPSDREMVLIAGNTRAGKSAFARSILRPRDQLINLDVLVGGLRSVARRGAMREGALFEALRRDAFSLPEFYREIDTGEALYELAGYLCAIVAEGSPRVIVEGVVAGEEMADAIRSHSEGGFRILTVGLRFR